MEKKLYRDQYNKVIGGVCAGLGEYLSIDVTVVRLLFAFAFFIMGVGLIPYIILWIVLPKKYFNPFITPSDPATVNYIVPPVNPGDPFVPAAPKRSNGGVIVGTVLILLGTIFLLRQFDVIAFWQIHRFWPLVLVAVGIALIVSGQQSKPWHQANWQQPQEGPKDEPLKSTDSTNDSNPTI